jgi:hypothetical protein
MTKLDSSDVASLASQGLCCVYRPGLKWWFDPPLVFPLYEWMNFPSHCTRTCPFEEERRNSTRQVIHFPTPAAVWLVILRGISRQRVAGRLYCALRTEYCRRF